MLVQPDVHLLGRPDGSLTERLIWLVMLMPYFFNWLCVCVFISFHIFLCMMSVLPSPRRLWISLCLPARSAVQGCRCVHLCWGPAHWTAQPSVSLCPVPDQVICCPGTVPRGTESFEAPSLVPLSWWEADASSQLPQPDTTLFLHLSRPQTYIGCKGKQFYSKLVT